MKNIHVLPTEKPSILYAKDDNYKLANSTMAMDWYISSAGYKPYNIYITSNVVDINENDYIITKDGKLVQVSYLLSKDLEGASNVILTTDQDLIKDGVQAIDDEFLEWFVKNPSCESVEILSKDFSYDKEYWYTKYKIIIPKEEVKPFKDMQQLTEVAWEKFKKKPFPSKKEEAKQETLEEAAKKQWGNVHRTGVLGFIEGAKWQQEQDKNKFSEEEVEIILQQLKLKLKSGVLKWQEDFEFDLKEWFKQFKNK
jgi:hypothetical protein